MAMPISAMTVRTSAKSTLIRPGRVISSAMPCTAPCSTWFAERNASSKRRFTTQYRQQLFVRDRDQRIDVLAELANSVVSDLHTLCCLPSSNGFVTTATVRMPSSFATCATIGVAPVPVPPPMPAVMNSMSAPSMTSTNAITIFHRRLPADIRIGARTKTFGDIAANLQRRAHARALQCLRIRVGADEINTFDACLDHVRDGVATAAADADDFDDSALAMCIH